MTIPAYTSRCAATVLEVMARPTFTVVAPLAVASQTLGPAALFLDAFLVLMSFISWIVLLPLRSLCKVRHMLERHLQHNELGEAGGGADPEDDVLMPNEPAHQAAHRNLNRAQSPLFGSLYGIINE